MIRYNNDLLKLISELAKTEKGIIEKNYAPDENIILQNEKLFYVYILKSGVVKCYITENNGKDFILEFLGEGEIIGELEILNKTTSLSNVVSITDLKVYKIPSSYFMEMLQKNWNFNELVLKVLATRLVQTASRASYQQNYPLEYSILKLVYLFSNQPLKLRKIDLAGYLGISTRSLNRTLLSLYNKNIIHPETMDLLVTPQAILQLLQSFDRG
ncbi:Crp/Fnr family transcriptional regulator [Emticicia sp. BO119]|uniref:Crp/Fnr family transcriptional regulator n=1 Tax=Emticicia sp. BO119 TaxID=2757768 RepID=UPI0015F0961D|nr:Crp/Fnr family transcriptional regulator [Emticicia sp. BO119]MBA4851370.1 Crp/Fnr family transcriptional regulator [Emticicia sp. BO119]